MNSHDKTPAACRRWVTAISIWLQLLFLAIGLLAFQGRIPRQVATHWGVSGPADSYLPTWAFFAGALVITVLACIGGTFGVARIRSRAYAGRVGFVASIIAGAASSSWLVAVWATASAPDADSVALGWRGMLVLAAFAWSLIAVLLLGWRTDDLELADLTPALALSATERMTWSGTTSSRPFLAFGAVLTAAAIAVGAWHASTTRSWSEVETLALTGLAVGVLLLSIGHVEITIDNRGVRLISSLLRFPLIKVALRNIGELKAGTIDPAAWGGIGYRISFNRLAYVTGTGPGLMFQTTRGRGIAISLSEPREPAAVLAAVRAQSFKL